MQYSAILLTLVGAVAAIPGGQPLTIAPQSPSPSGCSASYSGEFQITAVKVQAKRDLAPRSGCGTDGSLTLKLAGGILTDGKGRIGSIVSNYQFQFDGPPAQAGAIYTAGFSACTNGSLALGGSAVFYQCLSGDFYNLYDRSWAPQCSPVEIQMLPCSGTSPALITAASDGQPQGTAIAQIPDGQVQAPSAIPISEKGDGQPQVPTASPPKITQIGDGQVQAPTAVVVPPKVSQISDGQVQVPTGAVTPPKVTQISDGQIQVPTATGGAPISQISDGQIQVSTATPVKPSSPAYTGGATLFNIRAEVVAMVAGVAMVGLM